MLLATSAQTDWDNLLISLKDNPNIIALRDTWGTSVTIMTVAWETFKSRFDTVYNNLVFQLDETIKKIGELAEEWGLKTALMKAGADLLGIGVALIATAILGIGTIVAFILGLIVGFVYAVEDAVKKFNEALDRFEGQKPFTLGWWVSIVALIMDQLNFVSRFIGKWKDEVISFMQGLADTLVNKSIIPDMMKLIYDTISGKLQETLVEWMVKFLLMQVYLETVFRPAVETAVLGLMLTMYTFITVYMTAINTEWATQWGLMMALLTAVVMPTIFALLVGYLTPLRDFIENKLKPTLETLRTQRLMPLADYISMTLKPTIKSFLEDALKPLEDFINNTLNDTLTDFKTGLTEVGKEVDELAKKITNLIEKMKTLDEVTPNNLSPGSPVPFAEGLKAVNREAIRLTNQGFSALISALQQIPSSINMTTAMQPVMMAPAASGINNVDRSITIEVNPTYKNMQSEAQIYHDVVAALGAAVFR